MPSARRAPNLANTIAFVDRSIGQMLNTLQNRGLAERTLVIVSAKHGQSPIDRTKRVALNDAAVIAAPIGANFAFDIGDDGALIWLKDNTGGKTAAAVVGATELRRRHRDRRAFSSAPRWPPCSRIRRTICACQISSALRRVGVIYTGGSKIAEHGGFNPDDVHVALLVSHPDLAKSVGQIAGGHQADRADHPQSARA